MSVTEICVSVCVCVHVRVWNFVRVCLCVCVCVRVGESIACERAVCHKVGCEGLCV